MQRFISRYLTQLIVLPSLLLVLLTGGRVFNNILEVTASSEASQLIGLSERAANLVHEMQKERGMSAGFLGSKGSKFAQALPQQRKLVDERLKKYRNFVNSDAINSIDDDTRSSIRTVLQQLQNLQSMRSRVDSLSVKLPEVLKFYTTEIRKLIDQPLGLIPLISDKEISQELIALYNLMQAKERSGISRAVLSNILGSQNFSEANKQRIYTLFAQDAAYIDAFQKSASAELEGLFQQFARGQANARASELRDRALSEAQGGTYTVPAETWFAAATDRINGIKKIENHMLAKLEKEVEHVYVTVFGELVIVAGVLAGVMFLTWIIVCTVRSMNKQASAIHVALDQISQSNDLTQRIEVTTSDELGKAAEHFNQLLEKVRADFASITEYVYHAISATHDTVVAVVQSDESLDQQRSETSTASSAVEEMSNSIAEVSSAIADAHKSVSNAMDESREGQESVQAAVESIRSVASEVSELSESIGTLNQGVLNISSVLDVIQSVAEQTNLLALNAAIEAARAGEQGRGFAVVADEVRNLAKRVQSSTEEISTIIGTLQSDSQKATQVIESGQEKSEAAVERSAKINHVFDKIVDSVHQLESMTSAISDAAEQQTTVTREVAENVNHIDNMAKESLAGTKEIGHAATRLSDVTSELMDLINLYKIDNTEKMLMPSEWKYGVERLKAMY